MVHGCHTAHFNAAILMLHILTLSFPFCKQRMTIDKQACNRWHPILYDFWTKYIAVQTLKNTQRAKDTFTTIEEIIDTALANEKQFNSCLQNCKNLDFSKTIQQNILQTYDYNPIKWIWNMQYNTMNQITQYQYYILHQEASCFGHAWFACCQWSVALLSAVKI